MLAFPAVSFLAPASEPDVRFATHPALHRVNRCSATDEALLHPAEKLSLVERQLAVARNLRIHVVRRRRHPVASIAVTNNPHRRRVVEDHSLLLRLSVQLLTAPQPFPCSSSAFLSKPADPPPRVVTQIGKAPLGGDGPKIACQPRRMRFSIRSNWCRAKFFLSSLVTAFTLGLAEFNDLSDTKV